MKIDDISDIFRCPQCNSTEGLKSALGSHEVQCLRCGTDFPCIRESLPVLIPGSDHHRRKLDELSQGALSEWYEGAQDLQLKGPYRHHLKKRWSYLKAEFSDFVRTQAGPLRVADIGCGDGNNLRLLLDLGQKTYASDYNEKRLAKAESAFKEAGIFGANLLNYPVKTDTFDLILCNHVLEHIPDDRGALKELYRILRPGGRLVLGIPNEGAWFWRLAYRLSPGSRKASDHVHFYTAKSIRKKVEETGFKLKKLDFIGWGIPHWTLDSILRSRKIFDDAFEWIGSRCLRDQATSLYLILEKDPN